MFISKKCVLAVLAAMMISGCSAAEPLPVPSVEPPVEETVETAYDTAEPESFQLKLSVVGDIMCHTLQYTAAHTDGAYDFSESFSLIKPELADADLVIGNLETTFSGADKTYSEYPTFNTPDSFATSLADTGFDILTTANNHSLDRGTYGLNRTLDILDAAGLMHTGTYRTPDEERILYTEQNHIPIAVMSYSYGTNGLSADVGNEFSVNLIDESRIRADITEAREKGAELIIVFLHFGKEYEQQPNDTQKELAAACFEEGADMVLGTHPHVVQSQFLSPITDRYGETKNRFVAYSLGNFISAQRTQPRDASVIAHLEILKDGDATEIQSVSFVPTWVDQSSGAGLKMFRVLPVRHALDNPAEYELINEKDVFKLNRSWNYVTEALEN